MCRSERRYINQAIKHRKRNYIIHANAATASPFMFKPKEYAFPGIEMEVGDFNQ